MKLKYSNLDFTPSSINEEQYTLRAVFSTADTDRHGEIVDQKSWILDDFEKNPVILFGHDHSQPPVGKVIDLMYNQRGDLEGTIKFAAKEYPFANVIWNLYKGGFMRAFSVGFSAGKVDIVDGTVVLSQNTLFEISTVSVPANAMALAKSKGLDVSALEDKFVSQDAGEKDATVVVEEVVAEVKHTADCVDNQEKDCPCQNKPAAVVTEVVAEAAVVTPDVTDDTTPTATDEVAVVDEEAEIAKSLDSVVTYIKAGKVLSAANRAGLEAAMAAIDAVLEADKPSEDKSAEDISTNTTKSEITVETPVVRVVAKKTNKTRQINKAIRMLLKEKAKN